MLPLWRQPAFTTDGLPDAPWTSGTFLRPHVLREDRGGSAEDVPLREQNQHLLFPISESEANDETPMCWQRKWNWMEDEGPTETTHMFQRKKTKTLWIQSGILQGLSLCVFVCVGGSKGITSPVHLCVHVYTSGRGRVGGGGGWGGTGGGGGVRLKQGQNSASSPLHSLLPLTLIELHTRTVLRRVRFLHDLISNVHPQQTSTSLSPPVQRKIQI